MSKILRNYRIKIISHIILLSFMVLSAYIAFLMLGCQSINQKTIISIGTYPRHNEALAPAQINAVLKWEGEINHVIRYKRLELIINPKIMGGGSWPKQSYTYIPEFWLSDIKLTGQVYLLDNLAIFYNKQKYFPISNVTHQDENTQEFICNCTYSNMIGVKYGYEW